MQVRMREGTAFDENARSGKGRESADEVRGAQGEERIRQRVQEIARPQHVDRILAGNSTRGCFAKRLQAARGIPGLVFRFDGGTKRLVRDRCARESFKNALEVCR